jgi:hypothetical protein
LHQTIPLNFTTNPASLSIDNTGAIRNGASMERLATGHNGRGRSVGANMWLVMRD